MKYPSAHDEDTLQRRLSARSLCADPAIIHSPYLGALQPTSGEGSSTSRVLPRSSKSSAFVGFFRHAPSSAVASSSSQGLKDIIWELNPKPYQGPLLTQLDLSQRLSYSSRHLDECDLFRLPVATVPPAVDGAGGQGGSDEARPPPAPSCVICLETFAPADELRVLPCRHSFHKCCVDRWLLGANSSERCHTNTCPVCKSSVRPSSPSPSHRPSPQPPAPAAAGAAGAAGDVFNHDIPPWAFLRAGAALQGAT